jgi:dsDNA-specific endonuclease/ATPase MutS2
MGLREAIENVHASRKRLEESRQALKKLEEEFRRLQARVSGEKPKDTGPEKRRRSLS